MGITSRSFRAPCRLERLQCFCSLLQALATLTRDYMQEYHADIPLMNSWQLSAIARPLWALNIELTQVLIKHCPLAKERLQDRDCILWIAGQSKCTRVSDEVKTLLARDKVIFIAFENTNNIEEKTQSANPLARLWLPLSRTCAVSVITLNGDNEGEEPKLTVSCGEAWQAHSREGFR